MKHYLIKASLIGLIIVGPPVWLAALHPSAVKFAICAIMAAVMVTLLGLSALEAYELYALKRSICRIEQAVTPRPAVRLEIYQINGGELIGNHMQQKVTETKTYILVPKDQFGNVAAMDSVPVWALSDPSLGTLVPADDGLSVANTPTGPIAPLAIQASGDSNGKPFAGSGPIELLPGDAVTNAISQQA